MIKKIYLIIKNIVNKAKRMVRNYDKSFIEQMKSVTQEEKEDLYSGYFYHQGI